jgi:GGDEF domain-containing protein
MHSGSRRLEDLRREAAAATRGLRGGEQTLIAALEAVQAPGADDTLRRLSRELRVLMSLSAALAGTSSLDDLLDLAAEETRTALDARSVSVSRSEGQAEVLRPLVNAGALAEGELRHPSDEIYRVGDDNQLKALLHEGRAYRCTIDDPDLHPTQRKLLERLDRRSSLAVPVMLGAVAWGELWASRGHDQPVFDEHDLELLNAIAGQLAAGVGRAELFGRMAELALRDSLTGLANRPALEERLSVALEGGGEVALMLCDVDNLRELNDLRGHHGGDWALKAVASTLRAASEFLPTSLVCRLSGDEFGVLSEGASM